MSRPKIAMKYHKMLSAYFFLGTVSYIDAYLTLQYPDRDFEIINVGLPSETVSGLSESGHADGKFPRPDLHERLKRILERTKPDLIFSCYGMNDGIYLPFDEERFQKYKEGIKGKPTPMSWIFIQIGL